MTRLLVLLLLLSPTAVLAFDRHQATEGLPRAFGERDPSDPSEPVPRTGYRSVTSATKTYRPVDPKPWDELNRRVTPRPKGEPDATPKKN